MGYGYVLVNIRRHMRQHTMWSNGYSTAWASNQLDVQHMRASFSCGYLDPRAKRTQFGLREAHGPEFKLKLCYWDSQSISAPRSTGAAETHTQRVRCKSRQNTQTSCYIYGKRNTQMIGKTRRHADAGRHTATGSEEGVRVNRSWSFCGSPIPICISKIVEALPCA